MRKFAQLMRVIEILGGIGLLVYGYLYGGGNNLWYYAGAAVLVIGLLGFCIFCPLSGKCTLFGNKEK
jgi:peptidoglycan/LPS O-acetylase OafA/YrhL